jgi:hypothetical protein
VRDYFNADNFLYDPTDMAQAVLLYFYPLDPAIFVRRYLFFLQVPSAHNGNWKNKKKGSSYAFYKAWALADG